MSATKNFYHEQISSTNNDLLDEEYHYTKWQEEMHNDPQFLQHLEERAEQEFYLRHHYATGNLKYEI